jgi:hypothetical protein
MTVDVVRSYALLRSLEQGGQKNQILKSTVTELLRKELGFYHSTNSPAAWDEYYSESWYRHGEGSGLRPGIQQASLAIILSPEERETLPLLDKAK